MGGKKREKLRWIGHLCQASCLEISHQNNRNNNFISREPQKKSRKDNPVHSQELSQRFKEPRQAGEQAQIAQINISGHPDEQSGRSRHKKSPSKHEESSVKDGAYNYRSNLGLPVRGKLQREGGGHSPKQSPGQQEGREKGGPRAEQDQDSQQG